MRAYQYNFTDEMLIDNFAGGGGASTGIELATGRIVDIAVNHNRASIQMHERNHPYTKHFCEDVWQIDPKKVTQGRPVAIVWGSPDCTHFSKAKGGTPVEKNIRGLAWVLCKWAGTVKPRVIIMENVEEFQTWGPVIPMRINGRCVKKVLKRGKLRKPYITAEKGEELSEKEQVFVPDKKRAGQTFNRFIGQLRALGYDVQWKVLRACDYGAPTTRKRFFLVARCDGKPIVFPKPTHGDKKGLKPFRTASECIDFTDLGKSIFGRKKPLAENTMRRIAKGLDKFVIKSPKPFIMQARFNNPPQDINAPLSTITAVNKHYVVNPKLSPYIMSNNTNNVPHGVDEPLPTITTGNRNFLCVPYLSKYFSGENQAGADVQKPMPTITAIDHNALVAVNISSRFGNGEDGRGREIDKPLPTVTGEDHNQLMATHLCTFRNNMIGQNITEPLPTITAKASHHATVNVYLQKMTGNEIKLGYWKEIREMLNKYAGYNIDTDEILIIEIDKVQYFISDISMRMLEPRELARAQGFPEDYVLQVDESYSKSAQIARIGNSVCPVMAEALMRANLPELCTRKPIRTMKHLDEILTA